MALVSLWLSAAAAGPDTSFASAARGHCQRYGANPKNPWALAHGITAFGATFRASDGRPAANAVVTDYLQRLPLPSGHTTLGFARFSPDGTPIEPHTDMHVKTLLLAGIPPRRSFATKLGAPTTLASLVRDTERRFLGETREAADWGEAAWTLDVLSLSHSPASATLTSADGARQDLSIVMDQALAALEAANLEFVQAIEANTPVVPKHKQGIYAQACGGFHFVQAVLGWARHSSIRRRWATRIDTQIAVLFYRFDSERQQYESAIARAPQYRLEVLTQMLKFYGHFLETTARLHRDLHWVPSPRQKHTLRIARALLDATSRDLDEIGAWRNAEQLRASKPQIYLDLIGDACHAVHGIDDWARAGL